MKHHAPFTAEDMKLRPMVDMIFDLDYLTYLYPDKPTRETFETFKHEADLGNSGYVKIRLRAVPDDEDLEDTLDKFINSPDTLSTVMGALSPPSTY